MEDARRIRRAPRLVVLRARIVDDVVEPQGELRRAGIPHGGTRAVEERQGVGDVLERVVVAMGLRVRARDLLMRETRVGARPEPPPERAPRLDRQPVGRHLPARGDAEAHACLLWRPSVAEGTPALLDLPGGRT